MSSASLGKLGRTTRWLAAVLSLTLVCAALSSRAAARTDDGAKPPLDPSAITAAIELHRTEHDFQQLTQRLTEAEAGVAATQASLNVTIGELHVNQAQIDVVVARVRARAADAYQHSGATSVAPLDVGQVRDVTTARQYAQSAAAVDTADLAQLRAVEAKLESERTDKSRLHDDAVEARDALQRQHDELAATRAHQQQVLTDLGGVPVMGDAVLNARQLAGWYRSTGITPQLAPGTTIDDVAGWYVDEGRAEDVRGDLAFAQAIIETGSFTVAAGNNYSGIGVCDSCSGGYAFPTPRDGVRAQIQLLRNYADPDSRASNLAHPPSPALYGADPDKAARLYDTFFLKGKAPLWNLMGGGNWATDPTYAGKVIALFNQIVAFADAHPELAA
jgi:hypothetical protein